MIHNLHNLFSSGSDTPSNGQRADSTLSKAAQDSFQSALSEATATPAPPNGGYDPFLQAAYDYKLSHAASGPSAASNSNAVTLNTVAPTASAATTSTNPISTDAPRQTFDDAYWAAQPAAVRALRNVQDPAQRTAMATELANQGYSIDVPIMAWGWDPSKVTSMRQADGYTWVPSALQSPVEMAPGLPGMDGIAAYDPNNPPAGSIAV